MFQKFEELDPINIDSRRNPWVLRLEFDRRKLVEKNINMRRKLIKFYVLHSSLDIVDM